MDFLYPAFFVLVCGLAFLPYMDKERFIWRLLVSSAVMVFALHYMYWRTMETVLPVSMPTVQGFWIWFCWSMEILIFIENSIFYLIILRYTNRSKEADRFEKALRNLSAEELPEVDVFLPTYNEGIDVLERSIVGCLHLDWPKEKLKVWVLDDGKRDWLRTYCQKKGAGYIRRADNLHAKAGNINHAFQFTKGKFIAIFDADFIPFRSFLYRTIGFFSDPKVAIVQTPQHFFNRDFIQSNLHLQDISPDDQRLFFDIMMPSRDGWDAAFWCGSCSVSRREAMKNCGGVPTHSITEDLLTTLVLLRHGYITRYFNEKLSHGLAPETLEGLQTQRKRWCRGTIQALYSKDGPLGPKLKIIHRLLFFPTHWIFGPFTRILTLIVPITFLWTGFTALLIEHYTVLIEHQLPLQIMNFAALWWLMPRHFIPFLNTTTNIINAIQVLPTTIHSLFKPHQEHFAVTPKGKLNTKKTIHPLSFTFGIVMLVLTGMGIFINLYPETSPIVDQGFFPVAAYWACVNMITLSLVTLMSIEHPRWRTEERFVTQKDCQILFEGKKITIHLFDISMSGAQFSLDTSLNLNPKDTITLKIPNVGKLESWVVKVKKHTVHVHFKPMDEKKRDNLLRYLFTGTHDNKVELTSHFYLLKRIIKRAFGHHEHLYKTKPSALSSHLSEN